MKTLRVYETVDDVIFGILADELELSWDYASSPSVVVKDGVADVQVADSCTRLEATVLVGALLAKLRRPS